MAAVLTLTGCSSSGQKPDASPSASASASTEAFITDGLYEFTFTEKAFTTADGLETAPVSASGSVLFKDGQCALEASGTDAMGTQIRIVKELGKNGHVWDSVSESWTEMGSPYIPSLVSSTPSAIAFNRAAGEMYSFCAIAAFGETFKADAADPALYVSSSEAGTKWVANNIKKYAEGIADAAGLTGAAKDDAVAKIIAANTFGNMPETRIYVYDIAGLVTIEDATETSAFQMDLIRQEDKFIAEFAPMLKADEPKTAIADLAQGYIDSLK